MWFDWYRLYRSIGRNWWLNVSFIDSSWYIHRFISEDTSIHQVIKLTEFMQTVNFLTIEVQLRDEGTRFKIFLWWLMLARFVGAQFFAIEICHPFKTNVLAVPGVVTSQSWCCCCSCCCFFKSIHKNRNR